MLHSRILSLSPVHGFPPWATGGLVQVRERFCFPPPHVTLHSPQDPHIDKPPFTEEKTNDLFSYELDFPCSG